jgi:hypothetical protein
MIKLGQLYTGFATNSDSMITAQTTIYSAGTTG